MGSVTLNGATSGQITISPPAVAGSNTASLPAGTGTIIETVTNMAANPVTGTPSSSTYLRGDGTWAAVSASGQLIKFSVLTSGTSFTTQSTTTKLYIELVGGGGGGGGATNGGNGTGGGAGGFAIKYFTSGVAGSTSYTYAIGSGGAAGSGGSGSPGGNTTFTVSATTVTGGGGGAGLNGSAGIENVGGAGGTATNGDLNVTGGGGGGGPRGSTFGGVSYFGGGGSAVTASSNPNTGNNGVVYGSGASGGYCASPQNCTGGVGAAGVILVWEYT